jgi:predicted PurR-regulated permease PerM
VKELMLQFAMTTDTKIPFYAKYALVSIAVFAFVYTLYIAQQIVLPLIYATIIAILLNPLVTYLVSRKINKVAAIFFAVISAIFITLCLTYIISTQLTMFSETYPKLKEKFNETSVHTVNWASRYFNIKAFKINAWIKEMQSEAINNLGGAIGQTLSAINSTIIIVFLLPVYIFMILYYKSLLLEFIRKLFNSEHHPAVFEVLFNSKKIIQSYLVGLLVEALIMATLNSAGLLLLGIDYAIILGVTGALLNVIPYIGGVIAIALPMIIAYVTKDSSTYAILVLIIYLFIQFVDNHFIIPRIVASRVKINALVSIVAVLAGAILWGIPGMFLSIPLTAILKVIFDHIESMKPWGFLLGNIVPTASKLKFDFARKKNWK